ncbi:type IX secretion system sortase PorU [Flavobacterium aurantiibacter]|uniref:Peptidase C25 n=1 Tax=Flavobacterium aurantiibacter TaxID=2023067 RepID=A0A255ZS63_9FLAO|nr:type IX secretion system sortase PorU [Flavobacterium aurantiibacter]OYQ44397.1 peptidase C25 [Flavobacterium aurantiibacter]
MRTFLVIFLVVSIRLFGQTNGSISIIWSEPKFNAATGKLINPLSFDATHYVYDAEEHIIEYAQILKDIRSGSYDVELTNVVTAPLSSIQLSTLGQVKLPNNFNANFFISKSRNQTKARIKVNAVARINGAAVRLESFSYNLRPKQEVQERAQASFTGIQNSVLTSGNWYKFAIEKSGLYKISRSFLQQLGINVNQIDPRQIRLFGNGGRMLPLRNNVDYPTDLAENAIFVAGESDGKFDATDYILFYGEGVDNWSLENVTHNNLYATETYYYITVSGQGKRISTFVEPEQAATTTFDSYDAYLYHEKDLVNVARLGRRWFGEDFTVENERSFEFELPELVAGTEARITVSACASAFTATKFNFLVNGAAGTTINLSALTIANSTTIQGFAGNSTFTVPATQNMIVDVEFDNNGVPGSRGFLDYIIVRAKARLAGNNTSYRFWVDNLPTAEPVAQFNITNSSGIEQIWDITDIYNVKAISNAAAQNTLSFKFETANSPRFLVVDEQNFLTPRRLSNSKVVNQNLKGTIFNSQSAAFTDIDYIIITPKLFASEAERLANFHRLQSGLNVKVVELEPIFNEFGGGKQDIGAIRNFIRYVYHNASSPENRLKYLCLFGDASYDPLNRTRNNTNFVPIFHAVDPFSLSSSFISDDFFVLLDDSEGNMNPAAATGLDVAVGRMPVNSLAQAAEMVNKVIEYYDFKSYGRWRNNFVLISDDVDAATEARLQRGIDELAADIVAAKPFVNVTKIHTDSYIQESSAGGDRYPKARTDFVNEFGKGALVFNYFGHGGEDGLAHERILEKTDVQNLTNRYKYPLFVTITCEFTRFDNPGRPTAGEFMYWNPAGGAISLLTTTRQITIDAGQQINEEIASNLYGYGTNDLSSIAEALRNSKNDSSSNPLMVFYIGDPALELAIPKPTIVLTQVNDTPIQNGIVDLQALSKVKLTGEIRDETGNTLLSNYIGDASITVYDKDIERSTLANDGTTNSSGQLIILDYMNLGETIFRGNASVTAGRFDVEFIVPRDIRVPVGNGRISFYAKRTGQAIDQTGVNTAIRVGGINPNPPVDNTPPQVRLFMNDETFVNGGITNESPFLLAIFEDENGINTASGIGHDIIAILDNDESKPFIMNDYYESDENNYARGRLRFPFTNLEPGLHTIKVTAWDVYNNPVSGEIQFVVVGDESLTLKNVLNYPNPFVNYTEFWFTHNRPFEDLDVQVQVMTITGKVVWTRNQVINTEGFLSRSITWDGRDDFGDKIGKGTYIYKLTVRSKATGKTSEKIEKLVIL